MRKLTILLLLAGTVPPAFAAKAVTPDQVDQLLTYAHGRSDAKVAEQLFDLELTQRASSARLTRWEAELPGPKSRHRRSSGRIWRHRLRIAQHPVPVTINRFSFAVESVHSQLV